MLETFGIFATLTFEAVGKFAAVVAFDAVVGTFGLLVLCGCGVGEGGWTVCRDTTVCGCCITTVTVTVVP